MSHEDRCLNRVADKLTKESHNLMLNNLFVTWTSPSVFVRSLMEADIRGPSFVGPFVAPQYPVCNSSNRPYPTTTKLAKATAVPLNDA